MQLFKNDRELFIQMRVKLYTAVVGDIMDNMGYYNQFLPPNIRPIDEKMVVVGRAMTVHEEDVPVGSETEDGTFGLMLDALDDLREDEVYICSGSSPSYALVGELMSTRAKVLKSAGCVANGYIRDTIGIRALGYPTFAIGSYAQDQAPRGRVRAYRVPIKFGNVFINPGDIVFGDIDGVVIIPREIEQEVITRAFQKASEEHMVMKAIKEGMPAKYAFETYGVM